MSDIQVGSAYVDVLPDMDRFVDELAAGLAAATKTLTATIAVRGDFSEFAQGLAAAKTMADRMSVSIPITADMGGAMADLAAGHATAAAYAADHQLSFDLGVDDIGVATGMAHAEAVGESFAARDYDASLGFKVDYASLASAEAGIKTAADAVAVKRSVAAVAAPAPAVGGGGGKGGAKDAGGLGGLFGAPFFGSLIGSRLGMGGIGIPGVGAGGTVLKDLLGLSVGHLAMTGVSVGSAVGGGAVGGGILGAGALGTAAVGMGTDLAGVGQAMHGVQQVLPFMQKLNQAIAQYGVGSKQATAAQQNLNAQLAQFNPIARGAIATAATSYVQFGDLFHQATAQAAKTGAEIINQAIHVGEKYLPTIGQYAAKNTKIVQTQLQPFFKWLQDPTAAGGLGIFKGLEQTFSAQLPTSVHALTQGIELFAKVVSDASGFTGAFTTSLDHFFTKWNSAGQSSRLEQMISNLIGDFRQLEGFLKAGAGLIEAFFHVDAQTGQGIIATLTEGMNKLHAWINTTTGSATLRTLFQVHKAQTLELLHVLGTLGATVGPAVIQLLTTMSTAAMPLIATLGTGLAPVLQTLTGVLGPVITEFATGLIPVIGALSNALIPVIGALGPALITLLASLSTALVPVINSIGGPLAQAVTGVGALLSGLVSGLAPILTAVLPPLLEMVAIITAGLAPALPPLGQALGALMTAISPLLPTLAQLATGPMVALLRAVTALLVPLTPLIADITGLVNAFLKIPILGATAADILMLAGALVVLSDRAKAVASGVIANLASAVQKLMDVFGVTTAIEAMGSFGDTVALWAMYKWDAIASGISGVAAAVGDFAALAWSSLVDGILAVRDAIGMMSLSMVALSTVGIVAVAVGVFELIDHFGVLPGLIYAGAAAVVALTVAMWALDAVPIVAVIAGVGLAVIGLVAGLVELATHLGAVASFLGGPWGTALAIAVTAIDPFLGGLLLIIGHLHAIGGFLTDVGHFFSGIFGGGVHTANENLDNLNVSLTGTQRQLAGMNAPTVGWASGLDNLTGHMNALNTATANVNNSLQSYNTWLGIVSGNSLTASQAGLTLQQDLLTVNGALHTTGATMTGTNQQSLTLRGSVNQFAKDLLGQYMPALAQAGVSTHDITTKSQAYVTQLNAMLTAMGLSPAAIRAVDTQLGITNPTIATAATNLLQASNNAQALKTNMDNVSKQKWYINFDDTQLLNAVAAAGQLGTIIAGDITAANNYRPPAANPTTATGGVIIGGGLPTGRARAAGGPVWPGGTFVVGENGPELFSPKVPGNIIPTAAYDRLTTALPTSGSKTGSVTLVDQRSVTVGDVASMRQVNDALTADRAATLAAIEQLVGTG